MRTAVVPWLLALTVVLPAAAAAGSATLLAPLDAQDAELQGASAQIHLAGGQAPLALAQPAGTAEVWTYTVPCLQKSRETCVESGAGDRTSRIDVTGGTVTIKPTTPGGTYEGHLVLFEATAFEVSADQADLVVNPENRTHVFPRIDDERFGRDVHDSAPRFHALHLPAGPQATLTGDDELEAHGRYALSVFNATLQVIDRRGNEHRLQTGWTWQQNNGSQFAYERQLLLVNLQLTDTLELPWDGTMHLFAPTPLALSAREATLELTDGSLQGAQAGQGRATVSDLEVTLLSWTEDGRFAVQEGLAAPDQPSPEDRPLGGAALLGAGAGIFAAAALAAYYWPRLSWGATALVLPMYSRIAKDELLDNEVREQLYEAVREEPGIHAHALSEAVDIGWGTTVYHLRRLERNGMVKSEKHGRYRRFFPSAGYLARTREVLSVLQNDTTNSIARYILREPGTNQKGICEALDISPSLCNWHVTRLQEADLVVRERRGRTVHYFPGTAWDEVGDAVDPVVS